MFWLSVEGEVYSGAASGMGGMWGAAGGGAYTHGVSAHNSPGTRPARRAHPRHAREGFVHPCTCGTVRARRQRNTPSHELEKMSKARRAKLKLLSPLVSQTNCQSEQQR